MSPSILINLYPNHFFVDKVVYQKMVQNYLETLNWEVLPHAAYSQDLAPFEYHLFSSMGHALAEQHFYSYEDVRNWLDECFASKEKEFSLCGIHKLPEKW